MWNYDQVMKRLYKSGVLTSNLGREHFLSLLVQRKKEMAHQVLSTNSHHVHSTQHPVPKPACVPPTISDNTEPISRAERIAP